MGEPDPTMGAVTAAVERGRAGDREGARARLAELWTQVGDDGDPLHRITIAHFLADLQDDARAELAWDQRALAAVQELTDDRAAEHDPRLQVRGFLPSLQLNIADCHRRLGNPVAARQHLLDAERVIDVLGDDPYGRLVRAGLEHVRSALDAGSTDPLPSAP
jgi:hypothetical protein